MSATETMQTLPPATNAGKAIPGLYIGELLSIRAAGPSSFADKDGVFKDQVTYSWKLRKVIDTEALHPNELVGTTLTRYATLSMGPRSNMRLWAEAHLGRKLEEDEQLNVAGIIGTFAKIHVAEKQGERGTETHVTLTKHVKETSNGKAEPAPVAVPEPVDDDADLF